MKLKLSSLTFLLLISFSVKLFSQTPATEQKPDGEKIRKNSITLDITGLLHQLTNLTQNSTAFYSPYFLILHHQCKKRMLRLSLGGSNYGNITNPGDTVENTISYFNMAIALGIDCMHDLGKRFQIDYGIELGAQFMNNKSRYETTQNSFHENEISARTARLSPFLGIFWNVHPRIAIGTETSIYWSFINSETKTKTKSDQYEYNSKYDEMQFTSSFNYPIDLMVRIKF